MADESRSACGYDTAARRELEKKKQLSLSKKSLQRHIPFAFTACLAHVEITELESNGEISKVGGYFVHNPQCQETVLGRLPAIPLHEHVYEVALQQLEDGARFVICPFRLI